MAKGKPGTDEVFDALANEQRRRLLAALSQRNPRNDTPITAEAETVTDEEWERLLIDVQHAHLPKLDRYGFIDWDRETNEVTKGERFEEIKPVLNVLQGYADELAVDWI